MLCGLKGAGNKCIDAIMATIQHDVQPAPNEMLHEWDLRVRVEAVSRAHWHGGFPGVQQKQQAAVDINQLRHDTFGNNLG